MTSGARSTFLARLLGDERPGAGRPPLAPPFPDEPWRPAGPPPRRASDGHAGGWPPYQPDAAPPLRSEPRGEGETTLRDYLRVVRRRKWLILQALVLVPLVATLLSLREQRLYEATAKVLLTRQNLAALLTNTQDPTVYQQADRVAQTQADLARVPAVAQAALRAAGVRDTPVTAFLARSSVSTETNSDLLDFHVTTPDPARSELLATDYAHEYVRYRQARDTAALRSAKADVQRRVRALGRAGQAGGQLYDALVEKEQQLATLETLQTSNAVVVATPDQASLVQPRLLRNGLLGAVLGLVVGLGLAFLREALDTRVRSGDEIVEQLRLPLLGRLPAPERRLEREAALVMAAEPRSPAAEAFRMLRTNVEFANLEREARTIMITSAVQGEGKSTTIANLAVALARAGRRVVLVDLDLHRPTLARFFRLDPGPGVTDAALEPGRLDDAIRRVPLDAPGDGASRNGRRAATNGHGPAPGHVLDVVPAGSLPPDPGELVGSRALGSVLDELAARYDLVLIDTPPLLTVGDPLSLSRRVDAILLLTQLRLLRRQMLGELRRLLAAAPSAKLGFVLAGESGDDDQSYYGAYYGYETAEREPVA